MRKTVYLLFIVILVSFLSGCSQEPVIKVNAELTNISQEEYNDLPSSNRLHIDALKKITVRASIENSKHLKNRTIELPDLLIIDRENIRSVSAGDYERNNIGKEDMAESMGYVIFKSQDLNTEDIEQIFGSSEILISWTTRKGITEVKKYSLTELLEVE